MECRRYRSFIWLGRTGIAADLSRSQAETYLKDQDYVASPFDDVEQQCRLFNMKSIQCGVLVISQSNGRPVEEPIPYCMLLQELSTVNKWLITGEFSDNDVFHTHCMLLTNSRSDSCKRSIDSIWTKIKHNETILDFCAPECVLDVIKMQRCVKPESMAGYLMKKPIWMCTNDITWGQLAYDIDTWELNTKFKIEKEPNPQPEMHDMTKEICEVITASNSKTFEQCLQSSPDIMAKYLHRPGFKSIVENCLAFCKATQGLWSLKIFAKYDINPEPIHRCLLFQGIEPSHWDQIFYNWITKKDSKKNTIMLQGPSNSGKSGFIQGLKECVPWGEIVNTNSFMFEGLQDCIIGIWEEPLCSPEAAEKCKQVLEGMPTAIPIKYKKPTILPRIPIMITSNHDLWRFCKQEQPMFENRMTIFHFNHTPKDNPYHPRTCEYTCECRYCRASRGGQDAPGSTITGEMPTRDESISTTELSTGTSTQLDVSSGSLSDPGEGTSYGNTRTSSSSTSITTIKRTNTSSTSSSTCTDSIRNIRFGSGIRSYGPGDGISSTQPGIIEYLEPRHNTGDYGYASRTDGNRESTNTGTTRHDIRRSTKSNTMGLLGKTKTQKTETILPYTKKRRLGRQMGTIKLTNHVPLKSDWQEYLSYIYHFYDEDP
nr:nonstructural protein 1 [Bird parvovirus]